MVTWTLPTVWLKQQCPPVSHESHLYLFFRLEARAQTKAQSIAQGASREVRTDSLPYGEASLTRALEITKEQPEPLSAGDAFSTYCF